MRRKSNPFEKYRKAVRMAQQYRAQQRAIVAGVRLISPPPVPGLRPGEWLYRVPCPFCNCWAVAIVALDGYDHETVSADCPFCRWDISSMLELSIWKLTRGTERTLPQ